MRTIVFIFVPIYVEKIKADAQELSILVSSQGRQAQDRQLTGDDPPFWTWFIDNPRPATNNHP
jgi:hypothetical protein